MKKTLNRSKDIDPNKRECSEKACVHCFENGGCIFNHHIFSFTNENNNVPNSILIQMPKEPEVRTA